MYEADVRMDEYNTVIIQSLSIQSVLFKLCFCYVVELVPRLALSALLCTMGC